MQHRYGERGAVPYRQGRLRCINDQWFVAMRGPCLYGPYRDQDEAERALQVELDRLYRKQA